MNDKTIDQDGQEVLDPRKALSEQTLAVDLAGVEIDRAIATAHKYPRSIDVVVKKIGTLALYNEESAATCIYSLPRGSKPIIGPSIGFANIVLQSWGNCRAASQIVYIDTKQKVVIAQGAFMDLETNAQSVVPVNRRIVDSQGRLYSDDMQIVTGMAAASIARRNAILQGVPRGIWFQIWQEALGIVRGDVSTFAEKKDKALKAMSQFGVKPNQVFMYLGLKGEIEMTFEHIPYIRGMYQQLRDGAVTVEEMFDPRRMTGKGFETIDNPLAGDGTGATETVTATAEPEPDPGDHDAPVRQEPSNEGAKTNTPTKQPQEGQGELLQGGGDQGSPEPQKSEPAKPAAPAATAQATAKPAQPKAEPAKADGPKPTTPEEYISEWRKYCLATPSSGARAQRWGAERQLRKSIGEKVGAGFSEEQFDEMNRLKDEGPGAKKS